MLLSLSDIFFFAKGIKRFELIILYVLFFGGKNRFYLNCVKKRKNKTEKKVNNKNKINLGEYSVKKREREVNKYSTIFTVTISFDLERILYVCTVKKYCS